MVMFEIVVFGAGGERQSLTGERYESRETAELVLGVLVGDGRADASGPYCATVVESAS